METPHKKMNRAKPVMACWDGLPFGGPPEWPLLGLRQALGDLLGDRWFTPFMVIPIFVG